MPLQHVVATALAESLFAGPATYASSLARLSRVTGAERSWVALLCADLLRRFHPFDVRDQDAIVSFIANHAAFREAWRSTDPPRLCAYLPTRTVMGERPAFLPGRHLPQLATPGDLAQWLGLSVDELDWFADLGRRNRQAAGRLTHYRYQWRPKSTVGYRLLEAPKYRLRALQRQLLDDILNRIPPHEAAHGFRRGRSCLTHAALHVGKAWVVRLDLEDFFPAIAAGRVVRLFQTLGYPMPTARYLGALCTHATPIAVVSEGPGTWRARREYTAAHLPQGAPTSPPLANLCAFALDARLHGLAGHLGLVYSRYADDLALSGEAICRRDLPGMLRSVATIAAEEGFRVNPRKTRLLPAHRRQQLTGIVVNETLNVPRQAFDELKAILYNCTRHGPAAENRDGHADFRAHLAGRISHVAQVNPAKGRRLQAMFEQIQW